MARVIRADRVEPPAPAHRVTRLRDGDALEEGRRAPVAREGEVRHDPVVGLRVVHNGRVALVVCVARGTRSGEQRIEYERRQRIVRWGDALAEDADRGVDRLNEMIRADIADRIGRKARAPVEFVESLERHVRGGGRRAPCRGGHARRLFGTGKRLLLRFREHHLALFPLRPYQALWRDPRQLPDAAVELGRRDAGTMLDLALCPPLGGPRAPPDATWAEALEGASRRLALNRRRRGSGERCNQAERDDDERAGEA